MGSLNELTDGDGLVDTSRFPIRSSDIDIEWLEAQAVFCRETGARIEQATASVHDAWSSIREHYQAPEAPRLYRAIDPVRDRGQHESDAWFTAAKYIDAYTDELQPLKQRLTMLVLTAEDFRTKVLSGVWVTGQEIEAGLVVPDPLSAPGLSGPSAVGLATPSTAPLDGQYVPWHLHKPSIERNADLLADARRLFDQIEAARQELERRLRALYDDAAVEGQVGVGVPGRFAPGMAGAGADPADISWFAPDETWVADSPPGGDPRMVGRSGILAAGGSHHGRALAHREPQRHPYGHPSPSQRDQHPQRDPQVAR